MQCVHCESPRVKKFGKHRNGLQRFRCRDCGKTFTEENVRALGEMRISHDRAEMALRLLLEGTSIRSTERITGISRNTLCDLVVMAGRLCENFMRKMFVGLPVQDIQVDELWGFVRMKEKTRKQHDRPSAECGDAWCYLAIERHTKLIVTWHVGKRREPDTFAFAYKLKRATAKGYQLSTDGYAGYNLAVPEILLNRVDWGVIVKIYGPQPDGDKGKYSPAAIVAAKRRAMMGSPADTRICTSHVERVNLTLRMGIRRLTRLTNGFSKKWENHEAAHALFFAAYNFVRVHSALGTTPAVAAGLAKKPWTVRELLERAARLAV